MLLPCYTKSRQIRANLNRFLFQVKKLSLKTRMAVQSYPKWGKFGPIIKILEINKYFEISFSVGNNSKDESFSSRTSAYKRFLKNRKNDGLYTCMFIVVVKSCKFPYTVGDLFRIFLFLAIQICNFAYKVF